MKIQEFVWLEDRVNHISGHGITPDEVEEVCFGQAYIQRAKSKGDNPVEVPGTQYLIIVGSGSDEQIAALNFPPDFNNLTKTLCELQPSDIICFKPHSTCVWV